MKKRYKIEVECANCANKMEAAANKVDGVRHAAVNFILQTITVDIADERDAQEVMNAVLRACKKIEPDCTISY